MSAQSIALLTLSLTASATLAANRFTTHAGAVPAAGANVAGVARSSAASGDLVSVDVLGTAVVEASAAIALGAAIESTNTGKAVTKSTGATVARALQAASADGDLIEVLLIAN
ncbi:MAG: DUF2190 family protein [Pseudomonadota bacterium]|nr:DUF2190 family protein [Pseudomonadota bacterium]